MYKKNNFRMKMGSSSEFSVEGVKLDLFICSYVHQFFNILATVTACGVILVDPCNQLN